jgi:divalent metal cation (Fe/Co/Zn/Cd) transporter
VGRDHHTHEHGDHTRGRGLGRLRLRAEMRVLVPGELSVVDGHGISEELHHRLLHAIPRLSSVIVHTDAFTPDGRDHHEAVAHHYS